MKKMKSWKEKGNHFRQPPSYSPVWCEKLATHPISLFCPSRRVIRTLVSEVEHAGSAVAASSALANRVWPAIDAKVSDEFVLATLLVGTRLTNPFYVAFPWLADLVTSAGNKDEHHDVIRGSIGHYGLSSSDLELKTPLPLHLDHTHSVYVAVGTLISAVIIVAIAVIFTQQPFCILLLLRTLSFPFDGRRQVTACYCRTHEAPKWSPSARLPFLCRDYRSSSSPIKEDQG